MNKFTFTTLVVAITILVVTNSASATTTTHANANINSEKTTCKKSSCKNQDKAIQLNSFKDNWFIGIGGGISNYFGNHTQYVPFGRRISPTFNIHAGKWVTPSVGFRANFAWSNMTSADISKNNPTFDSPYKNVFKTKANMLSLSGEALFDVTNMIWGYKPKRVYSFVPYLGIGWVRNCNAEGDRTAVITGILNRFKINEKFDVNVDLKLHAFGEGLDRATYGPGNRTDLTTAFTLGTTYYFGKRNFNKALLSNCEIKHLQNNLKQLNAEKVQLEEDLAKAKEEAETAAKIEVKETVTTQFTGADAAIFFDINQHKLTEKQRVNLGFIANMIKQSGDKIFTISGYADNATGSAAYNQKLSAKRTKTVYDILVEEFKVNKNQLEIVNAGGVDNMFYNNQDLSRVVIVRLK